MKFFLISILPLAFFDDVTAVLTTFENFHNSNVLYKMSNDFSIVSFLKAQRRFNLRSHQRQPSNEDHTEIALNSFVNGVLKNGREEEEEEGSFAKEEEPLLDENGQKVDLQEILVF